MTPLTHRTRPTRSPRHGHPAGQRGVALIVALVVLVVIGLTSVAVMRGSLSSDVVANNARVQNFATQAAQMALRYCESQVVLPTADQDIAVQAAVAAGQPGHWESFASWNTKTGGTAEVPDDWLASSDSSIVLPVKPQCLAEKSPLNASIYIVTARGFSPDYTADDDGRTLTGSVIWLQSQVLLGS